MDNSTPAGRGIHDPARQMQLRADATGQASQLLDETLADGRVRNDAAVDELLPVTRASGAEPLLVETKTVGTRRDGSAFTDIRQDVHVPNKSAGQLAEYLRECILVPTAEGAVGVFAHGDVVVDVYCAAAQTLGKEPGHEQGKITEATKPNALLRPAGLQRACQLDGERFLVEPAFRTRIRPHVLT